MPWWAKGNHAAYYGQHPFWWSRHQKQLLGKILHDLPKLSLGTFCTHKLIQSSKNTSQPRRRKKNSGQAHQHGNTKAMHTNPESVSLRKE